MVKRVTGSVVVVWTLVMLGATSAVAQPPAENVVLVTLDGARHQEVFGGLDVEVLKAFVGGAPVESHPLYKAYWAPTPEERRMKLMPFFWGTLMREGSIAGNPRLSSSVRVTNTHHFSYPGYAEILTGEAHDLEINSNDARQNPYETVLEFVRRQRGLPKAGVAAFASWAVFSGIVEHVPGTVTVNAGVETVASSDPGIRLLNELQREAPAPWDLVRHDAFTFRLAMNYLKTERPRLLYLALDETDDWAHDGKYDLVLDAYARTDRQLRELWTWLQSDAQYKGTTSMLVTTDHGRGRTPSDWRSHGNQVPGADEIWAAFIGAGTTKRGEWRDAPPLFQNQLAATVARWFGLDLSDLRPTAGAAVTP